jgi:hypothetical protein
MSGNPVSSKRAAGGTAGCRRPSWRACRRRPTSRARNAVTARITTHVAAGWPRLAAPEVRFRGRYCYVAVTLPGHCGPTPFLRLRWQGSPDDWGIGIYKASTEQYSENEFPWSYGPLNGTPEQGIDETLALYAGPPAGK